MQRMGFESCVCQKKQKAKNKKAGPQERRFFSFLYGFTLNTGFLSLWNWMFTLEIFYFFILIF
jgi:hypothetical protein